jgi:hypothetical protein
MYALARARKVEPPLWKRKLGIWLAVHLSMDSQTPPRDDDPSDMTDFEKNATSEELVQLEQEPEVAAADRVTPTRGREEPTTSRAAE